VAEIAHMLLNSTLALEVAVAGLAFKVWDFM
jgi:hypothetical protein